MAARDAAREGPEAALVGDGAKLGAAQALAQGAQQAQHASAESDGDAAPERVLAAPAPDDFLARNVLACLLYDGALVTKEHVRAATRLAATSKAWKAVDDAWRATSDRYASSSAGFVEKATPFVAPRRVARARSAREAVGAPRCHHHSS